MTIHKAQGVTVDRAHVLAGRSMDRNMTYVAMSRHRNSVAPWTHFLQATDDSVMREPQNKSADDAGGETSPAEKSKRRATPRTPAP